MARDHNQPLVRIGPLGHSRDEDEELLMLALQVKPRLGQSVLEEYFWQMPAPHVPAVDLRRVVDQERDES